MKHLFVILLSLYAQSALAGYGGYIGEYDNRRYGSIAEPEYNGVVKLSRAGIVKGTGVFVSKNIILTNSHCVQSCQNSCTAEFWNGSGYETANLKLFLYNKDSSVLAGTDWGLLLSDKESNFYKPIAPISTNGRVNRGGYGMLRIIEDSEIPFLKELYAQTMAEFKDECEKTPSTIECINKRVDEKLKEMGKKQLFGDRDNFKVQSCNILGTHPQSNKMLKTDCDSSGGDSGAPLLRNGTIVGLNNGGLREVFGPDKANACALKTENFYTYVQYAITQQDKAEQFSISKYMDDKDKEILGPIKPDSTDEESETIQQMLQSFDCD